MKIDDDLIKDLSVSFEDIDANLEEVNAARTRLIAHIQQEVGRQPDSGSEVPGASVRGGASRWVVPIIAGIVVLALLAPTGGAMDSDGRCLSVLGRGVPCEAWLSLAAAAATAGLVGLALWLAARRS